MAKIRTRLLMTKATCRGFLLAVGLVLAPWLLAAQASLAEPLVTACQPSARLAWQAKTEAGVYGYLVYRAATRQGPFVRRNAAIVRAEGVDEKDVGRYLFVDCEVKAGETYYYYLDYVTNTGLKVRFSGVQTQKVEAAGEAQSSEPAEAR